MAIRKKPNFAHILVASTALAMMSACSTVRDTTDWVPGVSSNEEIAAEEKQEAIELAKKEREAYEDKAAFAPTTRLASTSDAKISVNIGQKFEQENTITREDIGIEVNAGVVTLTGNVASEDSAINAISIAKSTAGVSRVVSKLVVVNVRKQGRIAVKLPASTK
ncbi:MAG: BON domain-containing protein [Gammaproteobacteria bacterium]|nr:BON domain-containing protein [Gammaproteobacteria bacterium]